MLKINVVEIANALAVIILAAFIAWTKYKERKLSKDNDLLANPERCKDHETRLRRIEEIIPAWEERFKNMADDIADIKRKVNGK